jgi:hydroxymethylpyrimidine kinase/phosphomethylpyrimidine kinase
MTPAVVLTIAGSDSGGGAGIQADLKTFAALRTYGASVVTAVTAQNTRQVCDVFALPPNVVGAQLDAVLDDLPVAAVKVGMLAAADIAGVVAVRARAGRLPNLVLDPVLTASTGRRLGVVAAIERLLPYATVVTPNAVEASELVGWPVRSPDEMAKAAAPLGAAGPHAVVVTGGDMAGADDLVVDVVWTSVGTRLLSHPRLPTRNTHGTGCTFSAAVAARLAAGDEVLDALQHAEAYVVRALTGAWNWRIGNGAGPLDHFGWSV